MNYFDNDDDDDDDGGDDDGGDDDGGDDNRVTVHYIEHNGCNMKHCWRWWSTCHPTALIDIC